MRLPLGRAVCARARSSSVGRLPGAGELAWKHLPGLEAKMAAQLGDWHLPLPAASFYLLPNSAHKEGAEEAAQPRALSGGMTGSFKKGTGACPFGFWPWVPQCPFLEAFPLSAETRCVSR